MTVPATDPSPLVSCLCITEDRPAFIPWLLWNFDRQTWPERELVIVDSSAPPLALDRDDVRVIHAPHRTGVARKRNLALEQARGPWLTWFDDDDWQHPEKLALLAGALGAGKPFAGAAESWFLDLQTLKCAPYRASGRRILFNSAGFRTDAARKVAFPVRMRKASDTSWMSALQRRLGTSGTVLGEPLFFWLCHGGNISNPAGKHRFTQDVAVLRQHVDAAAWGDTSDALAALQDRLGSVVAAGATAAVQRRSGGDMARTERSAAAVPGPKRDRRGEDDAVAPALAGACPTPGGAERGARARAADPASGSDSAPNHQVYTPRSKPMSTQAPYRIIPAVELPHDGLPEVEGPVLLITAAHGKGLWYEGLSLVALLAERNLQVTLATLLQPLPERCEGWRRHPAIWLQSQQSFNDMARRHKTIITLEGRWWTTLRAAPRCRLIDIPNYDCVERTALRRGHYALYNEIWAKVAITERVLRAHGLKQVKRVSWDYAPDPCFHPPAEPPRNARALLYFPRGDGGVGERKGTDIVLRAFEILAQRGCPVDLAVSANRALAHGPLPPGVELHLGRFPVQRIADWYRQADWVLYPSRREGLGLTFFEAAACGTPVITTDAEPMNEPCGSPKIAVRVAREEPHPRFLAPVHHVSAADLAETIERLAAARAGAAELRSRPDPAPPSSKARFGSLVLITSFNRGRLLERTVESALATTPPDCRVLVVDDASRPEEIAGVRQRAREVERLAVIVKPRRSGLPESMNLGIARAAQEIGPKALLYYLQDDTEVQPGWHEKLAHAWEHYRAELRIGFLSGHLPPEHCAGTFQLDGIERPRLRRIAATAHGDIVLLASVRATNLVASLESWRAHGTIPTSHGFPGGNRRRHVGRRASGATGMGSHADWFLMRDGPRACIKRGELCAVLPGLVVHRAPAARESTWGNPNPEYDPAELAHFRPYAAGAQPARAQSDVAVSLCNFDRIVHLSKQRRSDGFPGGVAKFGDYLKRAIGCELIVPEDGADLNDPRTLYIVDNHFGLQLGPRARCITVLHGCAAERSFNPAVGELQAKMAGRPGQYVIANSDETAVQCRQHYGSVIDEVIPLAVDESRFAPLPPTGPRPRVLMVAKSRHKGAAVVAPLRRLLEASGRFDFELLDCPAGQEAEVFRRAQIFVNPSVHEGFSYALLEALAADHAVVTTAHGLGYDLAARGLGKIATEAQCRDPRRLAELVAAAWAERRAGEARRFVQEHCALASFERAWRAAVMRADASLPRRNDAVARSAPKAPARAATLRRQPAAARQRLRAAAKPAARAAQSMRPANGVATAANWRHPALPRRQWQLVARQLRDLASGRPPPVFRVGAEALSAVSEDCRTLLDVGCASGYYSEVFDRLARRQAKWAYTGCDLSPEMVRFARRRYPGRRFHVEDVTRLSYPDQAFDVVFTGAVLCHCEDYAPALQQLTRVARRYLVLHRLYVSDGEDLHRRRWIYDTVEVPDVAVSSARVERLAKERGFARTTEIPIAPGQVTWVLRREAS